MMPTSIVSEVRRAFELCKAGYLDGGASVLGKLTLEHGPAPVSAEMALVDPHRTVWWTAIRPGEVGLHGYPLADDTYIFCSDIYGHEIHLPHDVKNPKFLAACVEGYENGLLHDAGNVVISKSTNTAAFLVCVRLEDTTEFSEDDLFTISKAAEYPLRGLAWPNSPPSSGSLGREYACITALISEPEFFDRIPGILQAVRAAEEKFAERSTTPTI